MKNEKLLKPDLEESPVYSLSEKPNIELTEIELPDEEDRGFVTADGFRFRAKVQITDESRYNSAPNLSDAQIAPLQTTYTVTLAELNEDNSLKKVDGAYLIGPAYELLVNAESLSREGWSLDDQIMDVVKRQAIKAEKLAENRVGQVAEAVSKWGVKKTKPMQKPVQMVIEKPEILPAPVDPVAEQIEKLNGE